MGLGSVPESARARPEGTARRPDPRSEGWRAHGRGALRRAARLPKGLGPGMRPDAGAGGRPVRAVPGIGLQRSPRGNRLQLPHLGQRETEAGAMPTIDGPGATTVRDARDGTRMAAPTGGMGRADTCRSLVHLSADRARRARGPEPILVWHGMPSDGGRGSRRRGLGQAVLRRMSGGRSKGALAATQRGQAAFVARGAQEVVQGGAASHPPPADRGVEAVLTPRGIRAGRNWARRHWTAPRPGAKVGRRRTGGP